MSTANASFIDGLFNPVSRSGMYTHGKATAVQNATPAAITRNRWRVCSMTVASGGVLTSSFVILDTTLSLASGDGQRPLANRINN